MTPERWAQIEEVFHRVAESDPEHRTALLELACGNDTELRQQVEELLALDKSASSSVRAAVRTEFTHVAFSLSGTTVSHYRILEGIDGGGMGVVYRAEDIKLGRQVAIKFLPDESAKDPVSLSRFEREARSASALEHLNICPIYEFGEHEGRPFLVMQLLEGKTLRELIAASDSKQGPFELNVLLDLAIQILDGLESAHRKGIVHRDIKPANIFVTKQGQAKILDFGLAKLTQQADDDAGAGPVVTAPKAAADLFLSRTGVAMGTARYMSPEQMRGEMLDARTDLFSFGLVLYEMTTGKRALSGETGPQLQDAILNRTPPPAREVNPALPAKLERIINKALENNLQSRYQTAAEIRADLQKLKVETAPRRSALWAVAVGVAVCIAIATLWAIRRQPQSQPVTPEIRMRQLTANPTENPASSGMISPNGRYLAYTDSKGLHIKLLDTGETRDLAVPEESKVQKLDWTCGAWFPDSTRFLANTLSSEKKQGDLVASYATIWLVSVADRVPRKLGVGLAWAISPDGRLIAFGGNVGRLGPREIWLMDANGQHASKLFESGDEGAIGWQLSWTSDGRRVTYVKLNADAREINWISRDLEGGPPVILKFPALEGADFGAGALELGDGRMVFSAITPDTPDRPCNFWVMRHDLRTGNIVEQPRRLTNWTGFCMLPTSVSADHKKLVFTENRPNSTIYTAALVARNGHLRNLRRFTSIDSSDWPCDWTPDGKALIFRSNRDGLQGVYKQSLDGAPPKMLAADERFEWHARVSPDGKWILYSPLPNGSSSSRWLMRVPTEGGPAQPVFSLRYRDYAHPSCPRLQSRMCVLFQRTDDRKELVVTSFDPIKGPSEELTRIPLDISTGFQGWVGGRELPPLAAELSPDGTRIALVQNTNRVQILSLRGERLREIEVKDWRGINNPTWTSDGNALIVSAGRSALLRIGLDGQVQTLLDRRAVDAIVAFPSPDGQHLAIMGDGMSRNIWLMENF